jgi:hypothetical protein
MSESSDGDVSVLPGEPMASNADFPWDEFDASSYLRHNYRLLRDDDKAILELVRDFFASAALDDRHEGGDVGTGANLYPALSLLPWCKKITLVEHSMRNCAWLTEEIRAYSPSWDPFWDVLRVDPRYAAIQDPRAALANRATVTKGSVFDLAPRQWDIGTMFFVAESISTRRREFEGAVRSFLRSLVPPAPFAAAFMENSLGYDVGAQRFPAVPVTPADVRASFNGGASDLLVDQITLGDNPLRDGYTGMILVRGRAKDV